jgi:hypothetical protein
MFPEWRSAVHPKIGEAGRALVVCLSDSQAEELAQRLEALMEGDEIALTLRPKVEQWSCFFKLRGGETRFLVAHPEPTQWVATLALEWAHRDALVGCLRARSAGVLDQQFRITRLSNLSFGLEFV